MFHADLHVHSRFSRACSKSCDLPSLAWWAARKGVTVVGTGDFTHPAWSAELSEYLVPAEPGLFRLAEEHQAQLRRSLPPSCGQEIRFLLSAEISTIYKYGEATRKVHHLIYAPTLDAAHAITDALSKVGNLASDGRPILGLDSRHLLDITLNAGPGCYLIPAHIWTPWFAVLGSKSGFDTVAECYRDLAEHVFAVETGLSSDPAMNWMCSSLDGYRLVSNSDAHSPPMLGREATTFSTALDYFAMAEALRTGDGLAGTLNFFPEGGRYHLDGHRKCGVRFDPMESKIHGKICPRCGKPLTIGVLHRVAELADRPAGHRPKVAPDATNLVSLPEIVAEIYGSGPQSKKVTTEVDRLVASLGPELHILCEADAADVSRAGGTLLAEAITRLRRGDVIKEAGYDGEYGVIRLFQPGEMAGPSALFDMPAQSARSAGGRLPPHGAVHSSPTTPVPGTLSGDHTPNRHHPPVGRACAPPGPDGIPAGPEGTPAGPEGAQEAQRQTPAAREEKADGREGPAGGREGTPAGRQGSPPAWDGAPREWVAGEAVPGEGTPPPQPRTAREWGGTSAGHAAMPTGREAAPSGLPDEGEPLLAGLDPDQRAAALAPGPLMIIAGPGTGKTATLARRIAVQLAAGDPPPAASLALTFTRRAAAELSERLTGLIGRRHRVTVTTFHGLGLAILREHGERAGLPPGFEVADDQARLAAATEFTGSQPRARRMLKALAGDPDLRGDFAAALAARGLVDFDSLVELPVALLREDPSLAAALRERWPLISVDEYQDIDAAQYALLRLLAADGSGLTVIGDPDQSIYGFRGGEVRFFLDFGRDYPAATTAQLTRNYRSTPAIVASALQAVRPTTLVPGRELRAAAGRVRGPGRITTHESADDRAEAAWIAASIDRLLGGASLHSLDTGRADGHVGGRIGLSDIAVLYRTDAQASALGQALTRAGLPFQKRSHDLLTRRTAVPGIIHAMRLAAQATPDPRPGTAVNGPQDATGQGTATAAGQPGNPDATASDLTNAAGQHRNSPQAPAMPADAVPAPAVPAPGAPAGSIEPDTSAPGAVTPRGTTAGTTVAELLAGAVRRLSAEAGGSGAAVDVLAAGEVLTPLARRCGSDLARFLTEISLGAEVDALDPRADAVTLLTLHAAKGLEYAAVFLAGCERGLLPLWLPGGKAGTDEAEERRLLFVGMTRARTHLFLSWAVTRRRRGATGDTGPSPFLRAIDPALLDRSRAATPRPPAPKQLRLL